MFIKAALLLLCLGLWPACIALPPLAPSPPAPTVREAEETLFQNAEGAYRRHAYRLAWQQYLSYLERYPRGKHAPQARLREAELLGLLGDWQGSLRRYQALLAQQPEPELALQARYGIGRAYFRLGQYQQATQVLDSLTAAELPPAVRFSTNTLLAEMALKKGQVPQAFARLRLAAQDLPAGDQEWFDDLKDRLVQQATPADLEQLANLYRDTPLSAFLLLRLARLAHDGGRPEEAEKWAETLKERFPGSPEAQAAAALLAGRKRLVGCLLPLSGDFARHGQKVKQGMELAAQDTQLEIEFKDCPNDPEAAAQLVRDLAQEERLLALIGPLTSGAAQGAAQAAQAAGVPLVALSQKADLTQAGPLIFQAFLTARQQVRALLRHTLALGLKRYALLTPDSAYGRTFSLAFQEELAAQGGTLAFQETYAAGTRDFAPALAPLSAAFRPGADAPAAFDALFVPDDETTLTALAPSLADSPLRGVRLLGTNLAHPAESQEAGARALEGILFPEAFFADDPHPVVQQFIAAYRQKYGTAPDYLAAQGYAMIKVMALALDTPNAPSRGDLPQRFLNLPGLADLPWFKGFNAQREAEPALYILTIKDGRLQSAPVPGSKTAP